MVAVEGMAMAGAGEATVEGRLLVGWAVVAAVAKAAAA